MWCVRIAKMSDRSNRYACELDLRLFVFLVFQVTPGVNFLQRFSAARVLSSDWNVSVEAGFRFDVWYGSR